MILDAERRTLAELDSAAGVEGADRSSKYAQDAYVAQLETRLDWTLMLCEAMWSLIEERLDLTEGQLVERINQLDLADGELDGRKRRPPATCGGCKRTVSQRFPRCAYCGYVIKRDPFA